MSIMDKNEIIRISNLIIKGSISLQEALKVISEYCYEHNKNEKEIKQFLTLLSANDSIIYYYLKYALNYFKSKYGICTLHDKKGNIIINF